MNTEDAIVARLHPGADPQADRHRPPKFRDDLERQARKIGYL